MKSALVTHSILALGLYIFSASAFAQTTQKTLAEETLFSCIASYAQADNCNAANWASISSACNLAAASSLQASTQLAQGVQNGLCTSQNWANFSASVWDEIYPE